ncbi:MAG: carbohydrate ABC transporter permease [Chloroflexota bacterium]
MEPREPLVTPPTGSSIAAIQPARVVLPTRRGIKPGNYLTVAVFAGPALALIALLIVYPTIKTIYNSFFTSVGIGYNQPLTYTGLTNYANMFTDTIIQTAILNNILWIVIVTPATVGLGIAFAVLFDKVRYEFIAKSIVFIPMAISATAAGVIWRLMYADDVHVGTINAMLNWIHIPPISFLGSTSFVNWALFGAQVWMGIGFGVVVLSAALKSIPSELMEAARIDGANAWQIFRRITVPLIWPTVTVVATLTMIVVLKIFDIVYTMTGGGPAGASEVLATRMYIESFKNANPGYGSAIAVILLIAVLPIMAINIRRFRTEGPQK